MSNKEIKTNEATEETKTYKIIVKDGQTKDGKKKFKTYKLVNEENGRLVDCVMCKTISSVMIEELSECHKAVITGDISINLNGYEYPKAFIREIDSVEKIV